jgi:hypothetical protein
MKRLMFAVVSALSLLLCVGSTGMWLRSYWYEDNLYLRKGRRFLDIGTCQSAVYDNSIYFDFIYSSSRSDGFEGSVNWYSRFQPDVAPARVDIFGNARMFAGFALHRDAFDPWTQEQCWKAAVPFWFISLCCLALPLKRAITRLRERRRSARCHCLPCGYDLRASKVRCPECGTLIDEARYHSRVAV